MDYSTLVKRAMWALSNDFDFESVAAVYSLPIAMAAWVRLKARSELPTIPPRGTFK